MPTFQVRGPDGYTYSIEAPEGTPQSVLQQAIAEQGASVREKAKERTVGEAFLRDPGAALTSGLGALVQFPAQLYALGTGDTETGLFQLGERIKKTGQGLKSPGLVAREYERARKIEEAERAGGQLPAFGVAFGETVKDPALISTFLAEQIPQLVVPFGAAKLGTAAGAARAAMAGRSLQEGAEIAARTGTAAAIGAGAIQQGADVGAQSFEEMYKELVQQGIDPDVAKQTALDRARAVGASALVISTLAQRLPGARTIEQTMARMPVAKSVREAAETGAGQRFMSQLESTRLGRGITGLLGESASEMVEEVGGKLASNIAMQTIKPEQSLTAGLGATAAMAAIGGGTLGGVFGLLRGAPAAEAPPEGGNVATPGAPPAGPVAPPSGVAPPSPPSAGAAVQTMVNQLPEDQQRELFRRLQEKVQGTPDQEPQTLGSTEEPAYQLLKAKFAAPAAPPTGAPPVTAPPTVTPPVEETKKVPAEKPTLEQSLQAVQDAQQQRDAATDEIRAIREKSQTLLDAKGRIPPEGSAKRAEWDSLNAQEQKLLQDKFGPADQKFRTETKNFTALFPDVDLRSELQKRQYASAEILSATPSGENTELRLFKNKSGMFGVGVYDQDAKQYLPEMTLWPNEQQARQQYDSQVSKLPPRQPSSGETVTPQPQAPAGVTEPTPPVTAPKVYRGQAVGAEFKGAADGNLGAGFYTTESEQAAKEFASRHKDGTVLRGELLATRVLDLDNLNKETINKLQSAIPRNAEGLAKYGWPADLLSDKNTRDNTTQDLQKIHNDLDRGTFNPRSLSYAIGDVNVDVLRAIYDAAGYDAVSRTGGALKSGTQYKEYVTFAEGAQKFETPTSPKPKVVKQEPKVPTVEVSEKPKVEVGANKIFTEEAAEKARELLRRKLGGGTVRSGIDPEIVQAGIQLAGYHIEKGARTFAAYARAMLADLGDIVKPYLKSWYMGVKFDPRAADLEGLDSSAAVEAADVDAILAETEAPAAPERITLAKSFLKTFRDGKGFANINEARRAAGDVLGRRIEPGTPDAKLVDEAVELAGVVYGREVVEKEEYTEDIYNRLVDFNNKQMPTLGVRDSVSIANQAYSTPLPLAHAAIQLSGLYDNVDNTVLEPTAGQGALLIFTDADKATVNEINPDRVAALKSQGFKVSQQDAGSMKFQPKSVDVVLTNPPYGEGEQTYNIDGFETKQRDHAIALNALTAMKDDGRAVLLIGGPNRLDEDSRRTAYRGKSKREFFYKLYNEYNVVDHFTVAGDLYAKQGTTYPVDMIVIDGRKANATKRNLPAAALPRLITTWDELRGVLDGTNNDMGPFRGRETPPGGDTGAEGAAPQPPAAPPTTGGAAEEAGGEGRRPGTETGGEPAAPSGPAGGAAGEGRGAAPAPGGEPGGERPTGEAEGAGAGTAEGAGEERPEGGRGVQPSEPAPVDTTAAAGPARARLTEEQTQRLQVPYNNFSGNKSVNTLVATNHLTPIEDAFAKLREKVGDIDQYVQNKLQYTPEQFAQAFSAEQVEALALSIYNIESNRGFIIGDQTGIGKGRVVAGMIRYAMLNKKVPVFVTQMADLYGDIMRDLHDIGMTDVRPLMTDNNKSVPLDAEALQWYGEKQEIEADITEVREVAADIASIQLGEKFTKLEGQERDTALTKFINSSTDEEVKELKEQIAELRASIPERRGKFLDTPDNKRHEAALKQMMDNNSLGNYDVIFTSYFQMTPKSSGKPKRDEAGLMRYPKPELYFRHEFLNQFINENAMLIMDESHNIGKRSGVNQATGLGNIAREYIDKAGSVFYSSATFAKNVDVLDAYNKTDIGMAFPGEPNRLINALSSIPMQQAVSAMLVKATQYLRRERSFAGISYTNETVEVDQQAAEDLSTAMRDIVRFDEIKANSVRNLQADLDTQGEVMEDGSIAAPQVEATNFTSVMHNVLGTFLLSLKSKEAADLAVAAIQRGEKPVITVSNTMEMFIKDFAEGNNLKIGNVLEASFADVLERYLEKVRTVKISYPDGRKLPHYLTDEELGDVALSAYEVALDFIRSMGETLDIPISPIDAIKERIEAAGYSIGEITGRGTVVSTKDGVARLARRNKSELKTAGKKNTIAKFNEGQIDALIINRSGSTGLSMHASEKFADQRRRVMILAQAEPDINNHVQMLGRINRSGQVTEDGRSPEGKPATFGLPYYIQLSANVPIELRPAAVLANKMAALSANTTAGRKTATQDVKTPDFMNKYGDKVAAEVVGGSDLNATLGFPIKFDENQNPKVEGAMAKVTGRIGLLPLKEQSALYKQLIEEYNNQLALIESLGQNDLEAQVKQLDAKLLETFELQGADPGTDSPFTAPVMLHTVDAKKLTKPLKFEQVQELIAKALNGAEPDAKREQQIQDFKEAVDKEIQALKQSLPKDATDEQREVEKRQRSEKEAAISIFKTYLPSISSVVSLNSKDGVVYGVVIDVTKKGRTKSASSLSDWEVRFALVNGASQTIPLRLSQLTNVNDPDAISLSPATTMGVPTEDGSGIEDIPVIRAFDRGQIGTRQKRYIITGNLLRGKQIAGGGNLVSYTDDQGNLLQGFLMPVGFDYKKLVAQQAAAITSPQAALELADLGGTVVDKLRMGETFALKRNPIAPQYYTIEVSKGGTGGKIHKQTKNITFTSVGNKMRAKTVPAAEATELLTKVLSSSGYDLELVADVRDRDTKNIIDARNKPSNPPLQSVVPIQPVTKAAPVQTKRRIKFLNKQHTDGVIGDTAFIEGVKTALDKAAQVEKPAAGERVRGADYIRERLLRARRQGLLSDKGVELALWFIGQNPALVDQLGISISTKAEAGVAGEYNSIDQIIRLVPQVEQADTAVHEILHHLERMMPSDIQSAIGTEWLMQLTAAARRATTESEQQYFELLTQYHFGSPEVAPDQLLATAKEMIKNGDVPADYYQYINPSEFWAVNGSRIVQNRFAYGDSLISRLQQWLKEFVQKIKSMFGLPSDATVIRALDSLAKGNGEFQTDTMLFESDIKQSVVPSREKVINTAQEFLQKRKPLNPAEFVGVPEEFLAKAQPIYAPQRATIIDKIAGMRDGFWRRVAQGVADQYRTIKDYSERAYIMARMSRTVDGALEGLLFNGEVFLNDGALDIKPKSQGMMDILKPIGPEVDRFLMWIALNREAQLMKTGRQSKIEGIEDLINERQLLAEGDLNGTPRIELYMKARNELNKLNKSVLSVAMTQGLITSTAREIEKTWQRTDLTDDQKAAKVLDLEMNPVGYERFSNDVWYIPFYREMEDGMLSAAMDSSGLPNQYFSYNIKGGTSPFGDLMENIVRNWSHILSASMKNRAAVETVNAAFAQDAAVPSLKVQYMWENGKVYLRSSGEMVGDGSLQGWMTERRDGAQSTVKIMVEGFPTYVQIIDPMLFESISSIGYMGPQSKFVSVMKDFKNMLQYGVTLSPAFKVRNLFRDSIQAIALAGGDMKWNPVTNVYEGWKGSDKSNPRFLSALAGGAIFNFGSIYEGDQARLVKRLIKQGVNPDTILTSPGQVTEKLLAAWNKYQEWGNKSEAANRIALYNQLREQGKDHLTASFMARDLLDFSMQGSWPAVRFLAQTVPFFNARVQGLYKLGRDGISPTVRVFYNYITGAEIEFKDEEQAKIDRKKATAFTTVTSAVVLASLALYFAGKDDEEFKKRDAWDRDNFWWFKLPGMEYALRIPKPFEIGAFGTIAERVAEQIFDEEAEGKQFENTLRRMISDTFSLNPMPQMFKPLVDLYSNKDSFTGAPIESAGMERLSKEERKTDNTSPLAMAVSGISNLFLPTKAEMSPVQAEYAIKAYFGWLGGTIAWASKHAMSPFNEGAYPSEKWVDIASVGFIKSLPATQSEYVTSFYENAKGISEAFADMRHYAAIGDSAKVQAILEEKGDKVALAKLYDNTSKQMAKIRQYIRIYTEDTSMSAEDKRENIDRMKLLLIDLAKNAESVRKSMKQ